MNRKIPKKFNCATTIFNNLRNKNTKYRKNYSKYRKKIEMFNILNVTLNN